MAVMSNRLHHQRYVRGMRARSISVVKRETGKARSAVGLGEVEAVLSKLSFGTLLGSTVAAWGRAAFTDLRQEASGAAQERNGPEGGLLLDSRGGEMGGLQTLVSTPERTRKVPSNDKEKAKMASSTVHERKTPRFSVAARLWTNAVPINQGMNDAFSTGSQNHQPPQPNS